MDENKVSGTAKNIGGKVRKDSAALPEIPRPRLRESRNRSVELRKTCTAKHAMSLSDAAGTARDTASSFEKMLRNTIETQPYTSAFVALGIGWLLGRVHQQVVARLPNHSFLPDTVRPRSRGA